MFTPKRSYDVESIKFLHQVILYLMPLSSQGVACSSYVLSSLLPLWKMKLVEQDILKLLMLSTSSNTKHIEKYVSRHATRKKKEFQCHIYFAVFNFPLERHVTCNWKSLPYRIFLVFFLVCWNTIFYFCLFYATCLIFSEKYSERLSVTCISYINGKRKSMMFTSDIIVKEYQRHTYILALRE